MTAAYVPPAGQTAYHQQLNQIQNQFRQFLYGLTTVNNLMAQMNDGTDYSVLESQFGITTGKGAFVFSQVNALYQALTTNASQASVSDKIGQFLNQVG